MANLTYLRLSSNNLSGYWHLCAPALCSVSTRMACALLLPVFQQRSRLLPAASGSMMVTCSAAPKPAACVHMPASTCRSKGCLRPGRTLQRGWASMQLLRVLDLNNNALTGSLPDAWGVGNSFPGMVTINLVSCQALTVACTCDFGLPDSGPVTGSEQHRREHSGVLVLRRTFPTAQQTQPGGQHVERIFSANITELHPLPVHGEVPAARMHIVDRVVGACGSNTCHAASSRTSVVLLELPKCFALCAKTGLVLMPTAHSLERACLLLPSASKLAAPGAGTVQEPRQPIHW